jgi:hypothetical protein
MGADGDLGRFVRLPVVSTIDFSDGVAAVYRPYVIFLFKTAFVVNQWESSRWTAHRRRLDVMRLYKASNAA